MGLTFPKELEPCDPDTYDDKANTKEIEGVTSKIMRRVPGMADACAVSGWAGVYSITDDWYPIAGDVPGLLGYFHFVGGSGHGFKIAPPIAESLAGIIAGHKPRIDISSLRYTRFAEGRPFRSAWGPGNRG